MLINLMKSLNSCAFASALPLPDSTTFPSLKAGWKAAEQIFSISDGVTRGRFHPQFFHFAACLSRGGSPFERNPPNFRFARVLIQNGKLGVVAGIANPQAANGTLAFIKDPLVTSLPMFTITDRAGVEAKL